MKKAFLFIMFILLTACGTSPTPDATTPPPIETADISPTPGVVQTVDYPSDLSGFHNTYEIAPFYSNQRTDSFITAPETAIGDALYLIRNFPIELPATIEEINDFVINSDMPEEIEVYSLDNPTECIETISLSGMTEIKHGFSALSTYKEGFVAIVSEREGDEWPIFMYTFNSSGQVLTRSKLTKNIIIKKIIVIDDMLYVSAETMGSSGTALYSIDSTTGQVEKLTEFVIMKGFSAFIDNKLLVLTEVITDYESGLYLVSYDPKTGEKEQIYKMPFRFTNGQSDIAYHEDSNSVFYAEGKVIKQYFLDGTKEKLVFESSNGVILEFRGLVGNSLLIKDGVNAITLADLSVPPNDLQDNGTTLNILTTLDSYQIIETAASELRKQGYPLYINYTVYDYTGYHDELALKLLAADKDFDLFVLSAEDYKLFDTEYMADIAALYPGAEDVYASMLPGMRELCMIDSQLSLFPLWLRFQGFYVNHDYEDIVTTRPETIAELAALAGDSLLIADPSRYMTAFNFAAPLMSRFFYQDVALEEFADLTRELMTLISDGSIGSDDSVTDTILTKADTTFNNYQDHLFFVTPGVKGEQSTPIYGDFLAVNPESENLDMIATLLQLMLDTDFRAGAFDSDHGGIVFACQPLFASELEDNEQNEYLAGLLVDSHLGHDSFTAKQEYGVLFSDHYYKKKAAAPDVTLPGMYNALKMMRDE